MEELEIEKMIKEHYKNENVSNEDMKEILKCLKEEKITTKKKLLNLFEELDERDKFVVWDDSDDEIIESTQEK